MTRPLPPSLDPREIALFLDYDGTLIPYAGGNLMNPHRDPALPSLIDCLVERTGGATAMVSGRGVAELEGLIAPSRLPISGTHGAELRPSSAAEIEVLCETGDLGALAAAWRQFAATMPGFRLEPKHMSLVLHYHGLLAQEAEIIAFARRVGDEHPAFVPQLGKGTIEFRPAGVDKAHGIARLMEHAPFSGRRPVFIGDDIPDEAGFMLVNTLGGVSIRVGVGETVARHGLADVAAVHGWLTGLAA